MYYEGVLTKMQTENGDPIQYFLIFENDFLNINQLLDKRITIEFKKFQCLNCGQDLKIFRQGYCYDCFYKVPQAADWVIRPELSTAHLDKEDRDLEYEKKVQIQPHVVYLANTSGPKIGITRADRVWRRWLDQGAAQALVVADVPTRRAAGAVEAHFKRTLNDRTDWRRLVSGDVHAGDLPRMAGFTYPTCRGTTL